MKDKLVCETCNQKITIKNFWEHEHNGYVFGKVK